MSGKKNRAGRTDPEHTPQDRGLHTVVRNGDPGMRYCIVSLTDHILGVPHYEDLGWRQVLWGEGPTFAGRQGREGEPMERMGGVLMCIDRDQFDRIVAEGWDGRGGQRLADRTQQTLRRSPLRLTTAKDYGLGHGVQLVDSNINETIAGSAG